MVQGIIFDFDGVLVLSNRIHLRSEQQIFLKKGLKISCGQLSQYFGMSVKGFIQSVIDEYGLNANVSELVEEKYRIMREIIESEGIEEIPHAFGLAEKCKALGLKVAVASGSRKDFIEFALEKTGRKTKFDVMLGSEEVKNGKPDPEIFLKIASLLGLSPEECVVIEDAGNGVRAAKRAGMKCIAFKNRESGPQDLSRADRIVDSMGELSAEELASL